MRIAVTGSTGLVGSALCPLLTSNGHEIVRLVRGEAKSGDEVVWDPQGDDTDVAALEGIDAVVHLAGENIAGGRWNEKMKEKIRNSRVDGTRNLSQALVKMATPPKTMVCASAIGYYGDCGDELLSESAPPADTFLANVVKDWEAAAQPAADAGIRVVNLRIGVILSKEGGALAKMLTPFKLGVGGKVGSGKQHWSWIALDDVVGVIHHALQTESLEGPFNTVSPQPVTNLEFTKTLGRVLGRPTIFPMPAFAAKLALGEMAEELLLASTRVDATRLLDSGYQFQYAELEPALRHLLNK